jgi:hypothetical protein
MNDSVLNRRPRRNAHMQAPREPRVRLEHQASPNSIRAPLIPVLPSSGLKQ